MNSKYRYSYMPRWLEQGRCTEGVDPDLFYNPIDEDDLDEITNIKNKYCNKCPVRMACLYTAVNEEEQYGIWGGLTPVERLLFKRGLDNNLSVEYILAQIEKKWQEKLMRKARKEKKMAKWNSV